MPRKPMSRSQANRQIHSSPPQLPPAPDPLVDELQYEVTTLRVVWGGEKVYPIKFNGYDLGPIEAEVVLAPGANVEDVYREVYDRLARIGSEQAALKHRQWDKHLREAITASGARL